MSIYGFNIDWWNIAIALFYVIALYMAEDYTYRFNLRTGSTKEDAQKTLFRSVRTTATVDFLILGVIGYFAYGSSYPYFPVGFIVFTSILYLGSMLMLRADDKKNKEE